MLRGANISFKQFPRCTNEIENADSRHAEVASAGSVDIANFLSEVVLSFILIEFAQIVPLGKYIPEFKNALPSTQIVMGIFSIFVGVAKALKLLYFFSKTGLDLIVTKHGQDSTLPLVADIR